jgi:ABC-type bacteriocin/lantibiotic exporter with double-glycine peptidase domain
VTDGGSDSNRDEDQIPTGLPRQRFRAAALRRFGMGNQYGPVAQAAPTRERRGPRAMVSALKTSFGAKPIPFIPQIGYADCGPTALTMSLRALGLDVDENEVRARARAGQNGVSAATLVRVARTFGVNGRGVRTGIDGLRHLSRGSILFWRFNHFVVLEAVYAHGIVIVDPKAGRRVLPRAEVDESFTGIAVEFHPPEQAPVDVGAPRRRWIELRHFLPRRRLWIPAMAFSAVLLAFTLTLPLVTQQLVDDPHAKATAAHRGWLVAALLAATVCAFGLLQWLRGRAIVALQSAMERDSTRTLFLRLIRLPYSYFAARHPAELGQRLRTAARLRDMISIPTVGALLDALLVLIYLVGISLENVFLSLVTLALVLVLGTLVAVTWRQQLFLSADALDAEIRSASVLQEVLQNAESVKSLGAESAAESRWQGAFAAEITAKTRRDGFSSSVSALAATIQFAAPLLVLAVGEWQLVDGRVQLGQLLAVSTLAITLFVSLGSLAQSVMQLSSLAPELSRVRDIFGQRAETYADDPGPAKTAISLAARQLRFEYPGEKARAIDDIDVEVPVGSYTGILGASGSGKSTLAMLLAGLETPTGGRIIVDGEVRGPGSAPSFRERIGYVQQNSRLMSGSILENVRLGRTDAPFEDVERALRLACAEEFVLALPMKHETRLGVGGIGLSGGQRQRLALARALIRTPPLLILDEATNAVDPTTEQQIFENLRTLGCTLVVLGHRLNLVAAADQVIVLEEGRIQASGTPDEVRAHREAGSVLL